MPRLIEWFLGLMMLPEDDDLEPSEGMQGPCSIDDQEMKENGGNQS